MGQGQSSERGNPDRLAGGEVRVRRGLMGRLFALPRKVLSLAREGRLAQASLHCLLAALLALAVLSVWTLGFFLVLVGYKLHAFTLQGAEWGNLAIAVILGLPGLLAALVMLGGSLWGAGLGLLAVLRGQDAMIGSVGFVLNGGMLALFIVMVLPSLRSLTGW